MMNESKVKLLNHIEQNAFPVELGAMSPAMMKRYADEVGVEHKHVYTLLRNSPKVAHGTYDIRMFLASDRTQETNQQQQEALPMAPSRSVNSVSSDEVYVPARDSHFVRWGNFKDVEMIIKSREFYPTFITGLSGNGKTMMVEQACAKNDRQYVRVQITPETDEDDLLGGFRLIDGETVFQKGPVIKAMESGAILLIDEIDRGSNKIMCLQGVLEGKPVMVKKTGEMITPASGFNIIATANTKGQGSEDGRFVAATIIDEAFLERFVITIEQPYPTAAIENRIVKKHMDKYGYSDDNFAEMLVNWADTIRKTFNDGGVDETISTRRLCHVVQTFSIFKDRRKAIELCISRFDADTKEAFLDLYDKVDASVGEPDNPISDNPADESDISFDDILEQALDIKESGEDSFANSPNPSNSTNPYFGAKWNEDTKS